MNDNTSQVTEQTVRANTKELIDQRVDAAVERMKAQTDNRVVHDVIDRVYRPFMHIIWECAERKEDPENLLNAYATLIINLTTEVAFALVPLGDYHNRVKLAADMLAGAYEDLPDALAHAQEAALRLRAGQPTPGVQ